MSEHHAVTQSPPQKLIANPYLWVEGRAVANLLVTPSYALKFEHPRADERAILRHVRQARSLDDLVARYGHDVVQRMLDKQWLLPLDTLPFLTQVRFVEIETAQHCNWRCQYCPVHQDPKPARTMSLELFEEILDKARRHDTVETVSVNSYNEPTIDPLFDQRIEMLSRFPFKLFLHTNGSALTQRRLERLRDLELLHTVYFNLPCLDEREFRELTGASGLHTLLGRIDAAIALGLPVQLSINGTTEEVKRSLPALQQRFGTRVASTAWGTSDRAGLLNNRYAQSVFVGGRLTGCSLVIDSLHIGVDGTCFICCEDYYQREAFGNIRDGEMGDVLRSEAAIALRMKVWGFDEAPADFICRRCSVMQQQARQYFKVGDNARLERPGLGERVLRMLGRRL